MSDQVVRNAPLRALGDGVSRRVLAYQNDMMMVEVCFEKGACGAPHEHPHVQSTYVLEGSFTFTIDGREQAVSQGDSLTFLSNQRHSCVCTQKGRLLDVFTPMRDDFI